MAQRQITVVINGEEYVSKAADEADAGLTGFTSKIPAWGKTIAGLAIAYEAVSRAISYVRDGIVESFAAYDELANSQRKLEGTSKIAGISLDFLRSVADKARERFQVSAGTANELASVTALMGTKAGDASRAQQLLNAAMDIGAARGMNARDVMDALNLTLKGQDEGLDKLVNANPSVLYKEWAEQTGKSVGKMSDQEKMLAVIEGLVKRSTEVGGAYTSYLQTAQGKQAALNEQLLDTKAKIGEAMQPMRTFAIETLASLIKNGSLAAGSVNTFTQGLVDFLSALRPIAAPILSLTTVLVEVFGAGLSYTMLLIRSLSYNTALGVGSMLSAFGDLVTKGGRFLKVFGIDVVESAGQAIKDAGEDMRATNQNKLLAVENDWWNFQTRAKNIVQRWKGDTVQAVEDTMTGVADSAGKLPQTVLPPIETATSSIEKKLTEKLGPPLASMIDLTTTAIGRLGEAGRTQLEPMKAEEFARHMGVLREQADKANEAFWKIGQDTAPKARGQTRDISKDIEGIARGALDAASAFGVVDKNAANALTSVINMATSIGRVAGGDLSALPQLLGGIANVVSTLVGGDSARRELLRQNTAAMERLSRDISGMKLNITGADLSKAKTALSGFTFAGGNAPASIGAMNDLLGRLASVGLTMSDLKKIGEEVGIGLVDSGGKFQWGALQQLIQQLGGLSLGRVGMSASDQLSFFREGQRIDGTAGTVGGIQGLIDFLVSNMGATALSGLNLAGNPVATRTKLRDLFRSLNEGKGVEGIGQLTGTQFMDVLSQLMGSIDTIFGVPFVGGGSGAGPSSQAPAAGSDTVTGGGISVPAETVQAVVKAMDANIVTVLKDHTTLHERIAKATEGSYERLMSIDDKMTTLIDTTAGTLARVDERLAQTRALASLSAGAVPVVA